MNHLYLLQFACCLVTALMALMLVISRFQMRWPNKRYETSRWLLAFAMAMLSLHYILQMKHGIRAKSDEMGAVVNILYYTPIAFLVSYVTFNVACGRVRGRRHFVATSAIGYLLILLVFFCGCMVNSIAHLGFFLYVMLGLFLVCMFYFIFVNIVEMRRHRKMIEEDSGADMLPYDRYAQASYILMGVSVVALAGGIVHRPLLFFVGPLMLLSLFIFTMSFIAYGYNILPSDVMMEEAETEDDEEAEVEAGGKSEVIVENEVEDSAGEKNSEELVSEATKPIEKPKSEVEIALEQWIEKGGFRDSAINMLTLAKKLNLEREVLSEYFDKTLGITFRVWLSDIRFQEAKRMLRENTELSNDNISMECGFSSHAHLYKIFKTKTGMTPGQWKDTLK